jgi:UDP-N-acetylglucosamine acyltransferase
MSIQIHPTAIVDKNAVLGNGVTVGPHTVIEDDVVVGDETEIGQAVRLASGTRIGRACRIFHGASLAGEPQDLKFEGEKTELVIGDNTTIREFCTLNRGTKAHGRTEIGSNCLLMAYCHVAHDCTVGNNVIISNNLAMAGHVTVGDNVTIGGVVAIHQFTRVGAHSFIGATTYLTMDVIPFALCAGNPAKLMGINKVGLERRGFSSERREKLKRLFRMLFKDASTLEEAMRNARDAYPDDEDVNLVLCFMRDSKRGLIRM